MKKVLLVLALTLLAGTAFAQDFSNYDVYVREFTYIGLPIITASFQAAFAKPFSITPEEEGIDVELLRKSIPYYLSLLDIGIRYGHITEEKKMEQLRLIQLVKDWIGMED